MEQIPFATDDRLRALILAALEADKRTVRQDLHIGVLNGIAHLAGTVRTLRERSYIEMLARAVPGVRGVANRIAAPGAPSPGREINLDLKAESPTPHIRR